MKLDSRSDYGFTVSGISSSEGLPIWDTFRLEKIGGIFKESDYILDFGNSSRTLATLYEDLLEGKKRVSVDINECYKPDIVADICDLSMIEDESVDGIICAAILEHVYDHHKAVSELHRVLRVGGQMFVYVPWLYNYHAPDSGEFKDYYRFSKDAIEYMFREFSSVETCPIRGKFETILNLTKTFGKRSIFHKYLGGIIRAMDAYPDKQASGYNVYITK